MTGHFVNHGTDSLVDYLRVKGFEEDVKHLRKPELLDTIIIPDLVNKDFLKSISITIAGDLGGVSRLFQMIINEQKQ